MRVNVDDTTVGSTPDAFVDFTLTITNANESPTLANAIGDQDATEDAAFSFTFAADTFADVDAGDSVTYSATGLPSWLSFNGSTRTFSGTPTNDDVGTVTITVTAKDSANAEVSDSFDVVIANTNDAPTLVNAIADQSATEGSPFSFTFAVNTFADVDVGDSLTYSAWTSSGSSLPGWLHFNASTRTFSGTPTSANVGSVSIDVTATDDSEASVTETFDLAVIGTQIVVSGGIVTITDIGGPSHDAVGITTDGDNLVVTLEGVTTEIPLAGLTELIINGGDGDDTLNLDLSGGPLPFNIVFNGGNGGHDTLVVTGFDESGAFNAYNANYTNRHDGSIQFRDGGTILSTVSYTGLEPISIDGTPTAVVFNLPNTNDTDVTLSDIGGANGVMRLAGSTFETTDFSVNALTSITINGNVGNDRVTILGLDQIHTGELIIDGGTENDIIDASRSPHAVTLLGGEGNDSLIGSAFNDSLGGGIGNDNLKGGAGDDQLTGNAGRDRLDGQAGKDCFVESVVGNARMTATVLIASNVGTDVLISIECVEIFGDSNANLLDASLYKSPVTLHGMGGNDTLLGGSAADVLDGGEGVDQVTQSSTKTQTLTDSLLTGNGSDTLLLIERANLTAKSALGNTLDASLFHGLVTLTGGSGPDRLLSSILGGKIIGGAGKDTLVGGDGNDILSGGKGNDSITGGKGHDAISGGDGDDWLDGQEGDDTVLGDAGHDIIQGGNGLDVCLGGAGNDNIDGGADSDTVSGGPGNDVLSADDVIDEAFIFNFNKLLV